MSKRKRKLFHAPSKIPERYYSNLKEANVSETLGTAPLENDIEATDSRLKDEYSFPPMPSRSNSFAKFLNDFGKPIGLLVGIGSAIALLFATVTFFSTLTNDLNNIQSHVGRFESETKDSLKETKNKQDEMNLAIAKVLERFDRLFDKLNDKKQK